MLILRQLVSWTNWALLPCRYGDSARQGTNAVASAVNSLHQRCPNTQIVLVGYSQVCQTLSQERRKRGKKKKKNKDRLTCGQGGQIIDNAVCGGPDTGSGITTTTPPISASALNQVKAVIEMGSPRFVAGLSYNVGTCTAQGVSVRTKEAILRAILFISNMSGFSSPLVLVATSAAPTRRLRFRATATRPILTAALATTPTAISSTATSTGNRLWPLSRLGSAAAGAVITAEPQPHRPAAPSRRVATAAATGARAALYMVSVVDRDGMGRPAAPRERARRRTSGTLSVFELGCASVTQWGSRRIIFM